MAIAPLSYPGYVAPRDLDFSPLAKLAEQWKANQQQQVQQEALAAYAGGDPSALLRSGNMSLAQLYVQDQAKKQAAERDARDFAFRQEEAKRTQGNADRSYNLQVRSANRLDQSPESKASDRAKVARQYGLDPATPQGRAFILTGELPSATGDFNAQVEQRKSQAIANGLDPSSPGFQSFVLTGKMPREDAQPLTATDKKAILEADEMVLSNTAAIDSLKRATALSKDAFTGPTAQMRGYGASFLGKDSDWGKSGIATENLRNEVESNALSQLKAIFGGAPTEGERKILLDLQGSASKSPEVREEIYRRAQTAAERRLAFNQKRADELRGGNFYKPAGSMSRAPVQQSQGITQDQYNALPSGSVFTAPDGTQRVKP